MTTFIVLILSTAFAQESLVQSAPAQCTPQVVRDYFVLVDHMQDILNELKVVSLQTLSLPARERLQFFAKMNEVLDAKLFQGVQAFKARHGDLDCWTMNKGQPEHVSTAHIYGELASYRARLAPECEPQFASDYLTLREQTKDTMKAMEETIANAEKKGRQDEKDDRQFRLALEIFLRQAREFRAKYSEPFRCRAGGHLADSKHYDSITKQVEALLPFAQ